MDAHRRSSWSRWSSSLLVIAGVLTMFGGGDRRRSWRTSRAPSRSTRAATCGCSASRSARSTEVKPDGTDVVVTMKYDADDRAARRRQGRDRRAIASSGDRFVQITPVFSTGDKVLADNVELDADAHRRPARARRDLRQHRHAHGRPRPDGANQHGALSDLLDVDRRQLRRPGRHVQHDDQELRQAQQDPRQQQGGAVRQRRAARQVHQDPRRERPDRARLQHLARRVSTLLAGEREELAGVAEEPRRRARPRSRRSSRENRDILGRNIKGLNRVSKVLVKQRDALDEVLKIAPLALNNLALTYNPQAGTLDTRANLGELPDQIASDPATFLCGLTSQADKSGKVLRPDQGHRCPRIGRRSAGARRCPHRPLSSTRRSADSWRCSDDAARGGPTDRGPCCRCWPWCSPRAATSTSTSCRCPAAPTSATTRSRSR